MNDAACTALCRGEDDAVESADFSETSSEHFGFLHHSNFLEHEHTSPFLTLALWLLSCLDEQFSLSSPLSSPPPPLERSPHPHPSASHPTII